MTLTTVTTSPFEAIKQTHPSGAERWSARDLMPLMGYSAWRNFEVPIQRAMRAAENQGHDVTEILRDPAKSRPLSRRTTTHSPASPPTSWR